MGAGRAVLFAAVLEGFGVEYCFVGHGEKLDGGFDAGPQVAIGAGEGQVFDAEEDFVTGIEQDIGLALADGPANVFGVRQAAGQGGNNEALDLAHLLHDERFIFRIEEDKEGILVDLKAPGVTAHQDAEVDGLLLLDRAGQSPVEGLQQVGAALEIGQSRFFGGLSDAVVEQVVSAAFQRGARLLDQVAQQPVGVSRGDGLPSQVGQRAPGLALFIALLIERFEKLYFWVSFFT